MSDSEPRLRRVEGVAERAIAGETVLVPMRRSPRERISVLSLDEVGGFVWTALREPATPLELAARVAGEFEVDVATAERDLGPFLSRLRELGLVVPEPSPEASCR